MKKIIGITAAVLAALTLAGCSSNQDAPASTTSTQSSTTAPTTSVITPPTTVAPTMPDQAAAQAAEAARVAADQASQSAAASSAAQSAAAQSAADQVAADQAAAQSSAEAQSAAETSSAYDPELGACRTFAGRQDAYYMRLIPSHAYDLEQAYENSRSDSALNELMSWCGNYGVSLDFLIPSTVMPSATIEANTPNQGDPCTASDRTSPWPDGRSGPPQVCQPSPDGNGRRWATQ